LNLQNLAGIIFELEFDPEHIPELEIDPEITSHLKQFLRNLEDSRVEIRKFR